MKLSIDSLTEMGAFSGAPVEKEVKWKHGGEDVSMSVYVRRLSYRSAVADIDSHHAGTEAAAGRIASCICDEEGKPIFTVADITGEADPDRGPLSHNLTMALLAVIGEVNSLGKPQAS